MLYKQIVSRTLLLAIWSPIVFFSALLIHNSLLYYSFDLEYGILPEKTKAMKDPVWMYSFYIHVIAGVICLTVPVFSFLGKRFRIPLRIHKKIGQIYVWISMLIVAPTGMYLAVYAKGGPMAQAGFLIQGILLSYFTYRGYKAIREKDTPMHIQWMIRSYAMATAVLSFRIYHVFFFFMSIPYQDIYGLSQWLSVTGNALLAEFIILYYFNSSTIISLNKKSS
jgi:hypothetical protein